MNLRTKCRIVFFTGILLLFALHGAALADGPKAERIWQSGKVEVFALFDRSGQMPISLFSGPATPEQRAAYFDNGMAEAGATCFLIRSGSINILVDSGFGDTVPGQSFLAESLAETGIGVDDVNFVLLTHMHFDHIGGMLKNGERVFNAATVLVAKPELDYWLNEAASEPNNSNAELAAKVAEVYGADIQTLFPQDSNDLMWFSIAGVGVTPVQAYGHTPGHTVFLVEEGDSSLLIAGDLVHAASLQFALPDECPSYDINPEAAIASRKNIMTLAAKEKIQLAGMHIPFSSNGMVEKDGAGFKLVR